MTDVPNDRLLEQFARNGSEEAFAALVQRHIALVHSVALRHTANPQHAQDITQAVFVILARKAGSLGRRTVLPGWLYHTARLTAANLQRAETRRVRREQEAFMQSKLEESPTDNLWRELSPQLDEAMAGLGTSERDALVLRYFQNKSMAEVAKFLGLEENTAQKRVSRALEKLRKFFTKHGVDSTAAGIAENISAHSVQAVPVALAKSVTAVSLAKGAAASTSTLTLIKGALKIMAWTKAKTAIIVGAVALIAAGTATVSVEKIRVHSENADAIWTDFDSLIKAPPMLVLRLTQFPPKRGGAEQAYNGKFRGRYMSLQWLLSFAYDGSGLQTILPTDLPEENFDLLLTLPNGKQALRDQIKKQLGLIAHREMREADVLILQLKNAGAPGIRPSKGESPNMMNGSFKYTLTNQPFNLLSGFLESQFGKPVLNRTGLRGRYDVELHWEPTLDPDAENQEIKQALIDQLGLELVPGREPLEMLVVEKAK